MDIRLALLVLLVSFIEVHGHETITSCSQTPYPEICHSLATRDQTVLALRDPALAATMTEAKQAHELVSSMNVRSFDERAKLAWRDCLELYEDSVEKLNSSVFSGNPTTAMDTQTWISAAMTNHHTCQNGFLDFNHSVPIMLSNFEKFLSNSLAINRAAAMLSASQSTRQTHGRSLLAGGFPEWVSAAERKLLQSPARAAAAQADIVVAKDGSGNYKTISEAVAASAKQRSGNKRLIIHVKAGVYKENVDIKKSMKNLMFVGDGIDATIVTGSKNVQDGTTTFRSATFAVSGDGFLARDMTFENTAGPQKHQAVALRSGSDFSIFYRCSFRGYQDTLYVYSQRQFYKNCDIYGTVDFIFGDAVAVLQDCNIYVRRPMSGQKNTVTAQGRADPNENTGIVIHNSRVTASTDLRPVQSSVKTYLGRPWRKYSRTVFIKSFLDSLIDPTGWLPWSGSFALSTLYYGEYMNSGSGASTRGRVKWPGYKVITSAAEAEKFTVGKFLVGDSWIPETKVPYISGL